MGRDRGVNVCIIRHRNTVTDDSRGCFPGIIELEIQR